MPMPQYSTPSDTILPVVAWLSLGCSSGGRKTSRYSRTMSSATKARLSILPDTQGSIQWRARKTINRPKTKINTLATCELPFEFIRDPFPRRP